MSYRRTNDASGQEVARSTAGATGSGDHGPSHCEWCGQRRPLGRFWQPQARRYIYVCRKCSGWEK